MTISSTVPASAADDTPHIVRVAGGEAPDARIRTGETNPKPGADRPRRTASPQNELTGSLAPHIFSDDMPARAQHHHARGPYGVFRRPSKTRCLRATPTAHHRPAKTRDQPAQKDRRAHAMAMHRRMHMNQTVFSDTPHERGALGKPTVLLDSLGIIPACAGSTPPWPYPPW